MRRETELFKTRIHDNCTFTVHLCTTFLLALIPYFSSLYLPLSSSSSFSSSSSSSSSPTVFLSLPLSSCLPSSLSLLLLIFCPLPLPTQVQESTIPPRQQRSLNSYRRRYVSCRVAGPGKAKVSSPSQPKTRTLSTTETSCVGLSSTSPAFPCEHLHRIAVFTSPSQFSV